MTGWRRVAAEGSLIILTIFVQLVTMDAFIRRDAHPVLAVGGASVTAGAMFVMGSLLIIGRDND